VSFGAVMTELGNYQDLKSEWEDTMMEEEVGLVMS
jgi:hypothetical protein